MMLEKNPFYILGAMPGDSRQMLLERADERELFTGEPMEEAKEALLHPKQRLLAELGFFPGASAEEIEMVRNYLETVGDGIEPVPDFEPSSALSTLNGACAFLAHWPITDAESACAACLCFAGIAGHLSGKQVMEEINADRAAGGTELFTDAGELEHRLREHAAQAAEELSARCLQLRGREQIALLNLLADAYADREGAYYRSMKVDEFVNRYLASEWMSQAAAEEEIIRSRFSKYRKDAENCTANDPVSLLNYHRTRADWREQVTCEITDALAAWDRWTRPAREIAQSKGVTHVFADKLFEETLNAICFMNNECKDCRDAHLVAGAMLAAFTDVSPANRELIRKNYEILAKKTAILK